MPITAFYAALLAPLYVFLAFRVIARRVGARVALGDGGDADLLRRTRVHANFSEYAPMVLVLLGLAESLRTSSILLHVLGAAFVLGRVSHAWGVSQPKETLVFRQAGMFATFTVLIVAALACLHGALTRGLFP